MLDVPVRKFLCFAPRPNMASMTPHDCLLGRGTYGRLLSQAVGEYSLSQLAMENDVLPAVFINRGAEITCASSHSRGLNGTWRPPEGGFLGSFRGRHNAGRVQMSRGTACCKIHQKNPPGGHGLPEIAKSDFKSEIKTYSIPYTHQGVSGGSRKYFCSAPLPPVAPRSRS